LKLLIVSHIFSIIEQKELILLEHRIENERFSNVGITTAGPLAEELLTVEDLKAEFEGGLRRKVFCEFLGIGESTLSTWLQSARIPRMAAISYVLLAAVRSSSGEISRQNEPKVMKAPDGGFPFAVVVPSGNSDVGRIVAMAADLQLARSFAGARSSAVARDLEDARLLLSERSENEGDFFDEAASALERTALLLAEGRTERTLEELLEE
jgi:hypothetical protein